MNNKQEKIYNTLVMLSVALGQPQDPKRLQVYVENLKSFELGPVIRQIESFSRTAKYFPHLADIIGPLKGADVPSDELATIIASEIIDCISRFGSYQEKEAKEFLGEKFQIVERSGGWRALCQISYEEVPATRAQLRELAKAYINRSKRESIDGIELKFNTEARSVSGSQLRSTEEPIPLLRSLSNTLFIAKGE